MKTREWFRFGPVVTTLLALMAPSPAAGAAPLQGAAILLQKAAAQSQAAPKEQKPVSETAKLRADLTNFTARASSLAPEVAAREWLALADRFLKSQPDMRGGTADFTPPLQSQELIGALPPPPAWDALARAVESRPAPASLREAPQLGLQLLVHSLTANRDAQAADLNQFEKLLASAKRQEARQMLHAYTQINDAFLSLSDDTNAMLASVERQIAAAETKNEFGGSYLNLPDLVSIIGEAKAEPLLRRALKSQARQIHLRGSRSQSLARRLALEIMDELAKPHWSLCNSVEATELFEAMEKKFTKPAAAKPAVPGLPAELAELQEDMGGFNDYERQQGRTYYLVGLIAKDRPQDAADYARKAAKEGIDTGLPHDALQALDRAGRTGALDDFLHSLLSQDAGLPYWSDYFQVAAKTGNTERMLKLAREAAARTDFAGAKGIALREQLHKALLAADEVEEGVKELRALLAAQQSGTKQPNRRMNFSMRASNPGEQGLMLARLGRLLDQPEWIEEGLAAARASLSKAGSEEGMFGPSVLGELAEFLQSSGRAAEAEQLLLAELVRTTQSAQNASSRRMQMRGFGGEDSGSASPVLTLLVRLYHQADRPGDVLTLLEQAPHWGFKDLGETLGEDSSDFDFGRLGGTPSSSKEPLAYYAASALAETDRKAEALAIVNALLEKQNGYDPAYELLTRLAGQDARARLDELFARDPFEERPLIWKGMLLHQAGRHAEAEKVIRQAITIDPSDGEQGPDRRMRVYAVLADIREALGDTAEAGVMRGAVQAIRLSERADAYHAAGLLTRSVKLYQEALTHFADAYCIQSRLAVRMTELGRHEEAAQYYQRAFELMPTSFGRVESHCFGCEHTFDSPNAQTIAERVFSKLVQEQPQKPQVQYLMGYLRQHQGRVDDALTHLKQAVKLDPDYLNAWERIGGLREETRLKPAETDEVALNILRLDPVGRHAHPDLSHISDLRALWTAVEVAARKQPREPGKLLDLRASREALAEKEKNAGQDEEMMQMAQFREFYDRQRVLNPASAISQHALINALSSLIDNSRFSFMME